MELAQKDQAVAGQAGDDLVPLPEGIVCERVVGVGRQPVDATVQKCAGLGGLNRLKLN